MYILTGNLESQPNIPTIVAYQFFSSWKESSSDSLHLHSTLPVRCCSDHAISTKPFTHLLVIWIVPRKDLTSP